MKITSRVIVAFIVSVTIYLFNGCGHSKMTYGTLFDKSNVALIKPGITSFSEILEWFGPPDYIIDGTQRMVDEAARIPGESQYKPIPTRTLTSPEGMVILIYSNATIKMIRRFSGGGNWLIRVEKMQRHTEIHSNELFIYLSKKERIVREVAVKNGAK